MTSKADSNQNRRLFLKETAVGAASLMLLKPETAFGSTANSKITVGIIGCGGRGHFVAKKLLANVEDDIHLYSACDYFEDQLKPMNVMFDIDLKRCYSGLQSYHTILESEVDAVAITTPPYYHPQQAADAVEAGKHIWLAKPVGVDVPGCLSIKETGKKAEGKVAFLVDFQSRNSPFFIEAVKRVREGAVGDLVCGEAFNQFPAAGWRDSTGLTEDQARLRNYPTDRILSGDDIVDQAVHAMDIIDWVIGKRPIAAFGTGGLKVRLNIGSNWDHFQVIYWYENGPTIDLNCTRFVNDNYNLGGRIFGSKGVVHTHYCASDWGIGSVSITGEKPWPGTEHDNTWDIGVDNNCKDFVKAIRSGNYMNDADYAADSALTTILGRTAAYQKREVTWDEMIRANEKLEANLKL